MWAKNAKQKTNSRLQKSFKFLSSSRCSVVGYSFPALHYAATWDGTLSAQNYKTMSSERSKLNCAIKERPEHSGSTDIGEKGNEL